MQMHYFMQVDEASTRVLNADALWSSAVQWQMGWDMVDPACLPLQ